MFSTAMHQVIFIAILMKVSRVCTLLQDLPGRGTSTDLDSHTAVTDSAVFPYMAAVMKGGQYVCGGALIDENWVLTSADSLFLLMESIRFLRVRLGSINYRKGGVLSPIKLLEIHPHFDDKRPNYDLALIMLANPVRFTPNLRPIRLQTTPREVMATHYIVTSWPGALEPKSENKKNLPSMEVIKQNRILTVTHLHPYEPEECLEELNEIDGDSNVVMCLEPAAADPCLRDVGAPVVLNDILWGVVSSWSAEDCGDESSGPVLASLVSNRNVSSWIHAIAHGHRWKQRDNE